MTREDVWVALADQFLDTETRAWIPHAARVCVEAGLTPERAFEVWAYEVTPALWPNLWSVAGEWAGWERSWLCARIRRHRTRASWWRYAIYRGRVQGLHAVWREIEACLHELAALDPASRPVREAELTSRCLHELRLGEG